MDDRVKDGFDVVALLAECCGRPAIAGGGVDDGKIQCVVGGFEGDKEVEDFIDHIVGAGVGAVNLVDDDNRLELVFKGLAEDESRLRHRTFKGMDQQQDAVGHLEDALHLAAEVGVAGGVEDVDLVFEPSGRLPDGSSC